jgi:bidirectional [NiFe] hydrogenase diaphorase subunit
MPTENAAKASAEEPGRAAKDNREKFLERAMSRHNYSGDALIEVLHTAQEMYGHLTPELLRTIAAKLRLPPSHVLGVATFYHFFSLTACYVKGALGLLATLERRCAKSGSTSPDGRVSVDSARCIGACGLAPAVIRNGAIVGRLTSEQLNLDLDGIGVS